MGVGNFGIVVEAVVAGICLRSGRKVGEEVVVVN